MRHKARDSGSKYALLLLLCLHIGLLFAKRLDSNLLFHPGFTHPHIIGFIEDFFPPWRADLKISGFAFEFAGWVWTEAA